MKRLAKNRQQYIREWDDHIKQLIGVFLDADRPINDWEEAKAKLMEVIREAAELTFPEPELDCDLAKTLKDIGLLAGDLKHLAKPQAE